MIFDCVLPKPPWSCGRITATKSCSSAYRSWRDPSSGQTRRSKPTQELGGVVGRAGSTSVDYTLPALVERAIAELDGRLETLWR